MKVERIGIDLEVALPAALSIALKKGWIFRIPFSLVNEALPVDGILVRTPCKVLFLSQDFVGTLSDSSFLSRKRSRALMLDSVLGVS